MFKAFKISSVIIVALLLLTISVSCGGKQTSTPTPTPMSTYTPTPTPNPSSQSGGAAYDGAYDFTFTRSVNGQTNSAYGGFNIENGISTTQYITGTVSANGNFNGFAISEVGVPNIPNIPITGTFSTTNTFTLSGSVGNVWITMQVRKE